MPQKLSKTIFPIHINPGYHSHYQLPKLFFFIYNYSTWITGVETIKRLTGTVRVVV